MIKSKIPEEQMRFFIVFLAIATASPSWAQQRRLNPGDRVIFKGETCVVIRSPDEWGTLFIRLPDGTLKGCTRSELDKSAELNNHPSPPAGVVVDQPDASS